MKIAYLVNRYPKTSHSFIRREIRALEALGLEVERLSIRAPEEELADPRDREELEKTRVVLSRGASGLAADTVLTAVRHPLRFARAVWLALSLGWRSDRGVLRNLVYLAEACTVVTWTHELGVEHMHAHFGTNPPAVCMLVQELGGPGFSFTVHGPEEFDRPEALKLGRKVAAARFTVAVSSYGRSQLLRWADHADWPRVRVVHCGVDEDFLNGSSAADAAPRTDARRLVCVGRLCEQKGQLLLVQAVAELEREGVELELVLAGDGEMRAEVEALARQLGVAQRVRVTGWLSNADVRGEVLAARALVLPSFAEGLPVVLMEALALERPVISTYVAGIPELVVPGECGWLVPAGDVGALVDAMRDALSQAPERLAAMGRAGAERVRRAHDAAREGAKLAELIRGEG